MKGIVFTEFIEMVEETYSPEIADAMISSSTLESAGAYTSVGTYDHKEMVQLVTHLSGITGTDAALLLKTYGQHLFKRFKIGFPAFFEGIDSAFEMMKTIDNHIHVEVRKLYPDAELPTFDYTEPNENQLILKYSSPRGFVDFAEGLMQGCIDHFGEPINLERTDLSEGKGTIVEFTLTRQVN